MILVTGGLGFIGSHTVVALLEKGHQVLIVDDLSNSSVGVLDGIETASGIRPTFIKLNLQNGAAVAEMFQQHRITGIIHFAAYKAVGESVQKPVAYYQNNLGSMLNLLAEVEKAASPIPFIFSSSCTVYGEATKLPITENSPVQPAMSPYGNTKQIGEEILVDTVNAIEGFRVISLRYFNPIGAHPSIAIGELPLGKPQNLVPFITQTAAGLYPKLTVFGNDYPTSDGTNVRDYIHVVDLAEAHVVALERILESKSTEAYEVFNLGTGKGSSVLEVIQSFERVSGQKLTYEIGERREGDVIAAYADTTKANTVLGWKTKRSLDEAVASAWKWEQKVRNL
ncbi:MAG: UDP-glucose 4-epimerase GalE [Flavobacteriales bacterium]|nr:MAG: UDP-glucose 4-epimerase GalE [Flavobacteriales bacterium]